VYGGRGERGRIDTIDDARHARTTNSDRIEQIPLEIARHGDVVAHERPVDATNEPVGAIRAVEIDDVPPVLPVHAHRCSGDPRGSARFERSQIAGMYDRGIEAPEQAIK